MRVASMWKLAGSVTAFGRPISEGEPPTLLAWFDDGVEVGETVAIRWIGPRLFAYTEVVDVLPDGWVELPLRVRAAP